MHFKTFLISEASNLVVVSLPEFFCYVMADECLPPADGPPKHSHSSRHTREELPARRRHQDCANDSPLG